MTPEAKEALACMTERPAALGRALGYADLRDGLHGEWMKRMILGKEDMTLQAHRGSYKTTCLCVALAVTMAVRPDRTLMFLRKTDADVVEVVRQVTRILRHPVMRRLTGLLYADADGRARPVEIARANQSEVTTGLYAAPRGAAQLTGIGIGGSLTGKHADLIVTDDIVNLRDRVSQAERERTRAAYMELQNVRNRGGRIVNTGTPWHRDDAFALMPKAQKYDCYSTGLISPEGIERLKRSMSPSLFAANYELRHIASENALFASARPFVEDAGLLRDGIAHIDAAYGGGDCTALTCARRRGDEIFLYGRLWRAHVDTVLGEALAECARLLCAPIFCESNGDKGYLAREIARAGGRPCVYQETTNKYVKISSFLRKWWEHIRFLQGTDAEYVAQIMDYTAEAEHDDAPDSAACACRVLDARGDGDGYVSIFERRTGR